MARAISSLPLPVSPVISTAALPRATRSTMAMSLCISSLQISASTSWKRMAKGVAVTVLPLQIRKNVLVHMQSFPFCLPCQYPAGHQKGKTMVPDSAPSKIGFEPIWPNTGGQPVQAKGADGEVRVFSFSHLGRKREW